MIMNRRQNSGTAHYPGRLAAALVGIGVFAGATACCGTARAGYLYDPSYAPETPGHSATGPKKTDLDLALGYFERGELARCLESLKAARLSNPELFPPHVILAELHLRANQVPQAREALERAAVLEPYCARVYIELGKLALGEGRGTEAAVLFEKALGLAAAPGNSEATRKSSQADASAGLAIVAEHRTDWPRVAACLTTWIESNPKDAQARVRLARALFRQAQRDKVIEELQHAVQDDPSLDPAAILMARFYSEAGDVKKAGEWVEYALKSAPRDPRAQLGAALHYLENDQLERARGHAEAAAKLDPGSAAIKEARGLIAWHRKDYAEAERLFQEVVVEAPGNVGASCLWALALAEQPSAAKHSRALQLAETLARIDSSSGTVLTTLGWVYHKNGKSDEAERALRAALQSGTASSEAPYYLARVLSEHGSKDDVGPLLKLALNAPGRFAFRSEAREWLARVSR
jgi:tetratricopeptide (TPR) repeat protein